MTPRCHNNIFTLKKLTNNEHCQGAPTACVTYYSLKYVITIEKQASCDVTMQVESSAFLHCPLVDTTQDSQVRVCTVLHYSIHPHGTHSFFTVLWWTPHRTVRCTVLYTLMVHSFFTVLCGGHHIGQSGVFVVHTITASL